MSLGAWNGNLDVKNSVIAQLQARKQAGLISQDVDRVGNWGTLAWIEVSGVSYNKDEFAFRSAIGVEQWGIVSFIDYVFVGLPLEEAPSFAVDVWRAIPVKGDLDNFIPTMRLWMLTDPVGSRNQHSEDMLFVSRNTNAIASLRRVLAGNQITREEERLINDQTNVENVARGFAWDVVKKTSGRASEVFDSARFDYYRTIAAEVVRVLSNVPIVS